MKGHACAGAFERNTDMTWRQEDRLMGRGRGGEGTQIPLIPIAQILRELSDVGWCRWAHEYLEKKGRCNER